MEKINTDSTRQGVSDDEVLTVWADRTEPPDEIARQLRQRNRQNDKEPVIDNEPL